MELLPVQSDILNELLNIAMGKTASILSQMIDRTVNINIPKSLLVSHQMLRTLFEAKYKKDIQEDMLGVTANFSGKCCGSTTLFFEQHQGKTLVDKLIVQQDDDDWDFEENHGLEPTDEQGLFSDTDREALLEVGNMLINALMGTIGNLLDIHVDCSLPELQVPFRFEEAKTGEIENEVKDTLVLETHFIDHFEEIGGHLIIIFSLGEYTQNLLNAVDNLAKDIPEDDF